ncbi:MAG: TraB/GumN family protein [Bacteroidia bacterium]|nr:TraB/GumN family protein [Bacteroidia bacterium]
MRIYLFCCFYIILGGIPFFTHAQPRQYDFFVKPEDNSLLFKVWGNGMKGCSYLYGTIHAICEDDINTPPVLLKSLKSSRQLYLEIDMDDMKELFMAQVNLVLPSDSSLKFLLTEEEYSYVYQFFQDSLQKDLEQYENIRPILISGILYPNLYNCPKPQPFESTLMAIAHKQNKEVLGLESIKNQIDAFDKIPLKIQANSFLNQIKKYDYDKMKAAYDSMYFFYRKNDLIGLSRIILENESMNANIRGFEDILLFERNKRWLNVIVRASKTKPTFYAFGAAHLVGENSIIDLLRKSGYNVKAIKY